MVKHLAIIMDGNRRWAKKQGLRPWLGHKRGADAVERILEFCLNKSIQHLSLYTFSLENLENRSEMERSYIFNEILVKHAKDKLELFLKNNIRVRFIGERSLIPNGVMPAINFLENETANCNALQLNFLFCYGARQEIVATVKKIAQEVKEGKIDPDHLDQKTFERSLWLNHAPEPDLVIRTGGVKRLSNFLLYQAAYSEFYFLDCLWPEITEDDLNEAVTFFKSTKRNFGL